MKKLRVIVRTESSRHWVYVDRDGAHSLYAVADKLRQAKSLVQKAKRELGIAKGCLGLSRAKSGK
jgi:hypothetical protein